MKRVNNVKILIDSDNCAFQNSASGVRTKIINHYNYLSKQAEVKLFDKWNDNLEDYDLLHVFRASPEQLRTIKLAKSKGIPVVVSSIIPKGNRLKVQYSCAFNRIFKLDSHYYNLFSIFSNADIIVAETIYEKKNLMKCYGVSEDKIVVIPNGVCIDQKCDDGSLFRERTGIQDNQPIVIQVGRFDPNKNQLSVVRAAKEIDAYIVFIGGPDKNNVSYYNKCKQEAGDNVIFMGWIDHEDPLLYSGYAAAKSLILPSHNEIFGNVLFEAALFDTNLILTNVLPIKEWGFIDHCEVVDPRNIKDIKEKIEISLKRPNSDYIGNIIRDSFSWESIIEKHMDLYRSLIYEK